MHALSFVLAPLLRLLHHRLRLDRLGRFLGGAGVRGWQWRRKFGLGFGLGLGLGLALADQVGKQLGGLALLSKKRSNVLATFQATVLAAF